MTDIDEYADEAAELDKLPELGADTGGNGDDEALTAESTYSGRCHGGPWDTATVTVRYPKGFLLIHMAARSLWIYDRRADGDFWVRSDAPSVLKNDGDVNRWRAAEEPNYDIRALDAGPAESGVTR